MSGIDLIFVFKVRFSCDFNRLIEIHVKPGGDGIFSSKFTAFFFPR